MSSQHSEQPANPDTPNFDKNLFYVMFADGSDQVVIANNEDEITGASLVISLEEIERIRERLVATRLAIESADSVEISPLAGPIEKVADGAQNQTP